MILVALIGATLIFTRSTIFAWVRRNVWPDLTECSQCVGFWVGAAAGGYGLFSFGQGRWIDAAIAGCLVSFCALSADLVLLKLGDGPK